MSAFVRGTPPRTIPALQSWTAGEGCFVLTEQSRVVCVRGSPPAVEDIARRLIDELTCAAGWSVCSGMPSDRRPGGDVLLAVGPVDTTLGDEGYEVEIGSNLRVSAATVVGLFNGTRTLLQWFAQSTTVAAGWARDWPLHRERGLMIDIGRRHFPAVWLEDRIRRMAALKMNYLHLHVSDNEGFGIETRWLDEDQERLSRRDLDALIAFARDHNVAIVPEIDMPGHMGALLARHPQFGLQNRLGVRSTTVLAINECEALDFATQVIEEFVDCFESKYWHIGADEVMPSFNRRLYPVFDAFCDDRSGLLPDPVHSFINQVNRDVVSSGKRSRIWNDSIDSVRSSAVDHAVIVEWWTDLAPLSDWHPATPAQVLEGGHDIMNCGWWPTYVVPGRHLPPPPVDIKVAYEQWTVNDFCGPLFLSSRLRLPPHSIATDDPRNSGTKLHVWNEASGHLSDAQIAESISERLAVIAQKAWGSPQDLTYEAFERLSATARVDRLLRCD